MFRNELFESVIREASENHSSKSLGSMESFHSHEKALFEEVLREVISVCSIKIKKTNTYRKWYSELKNEELKGIIRKRLANIKKGNFGEIRPEGGVSALYIDYRQGFRLYYIKSGNIVVILLCGGNKSTQKADILKANNLVEKMKMNMKKKRKRK